MWKRIVRREGFEPGPVLRRQQITQTDGPPPNHEDVPTDSMAAVS